MVAKEKIYVFGKSALDISSLIIRGTKVDLSVYVDCEKLAICRTKCYNRLVRYKNALHKVDEIGKEIRRDFDGDVPLRVKRLAKDPGKSLEAKKSLNFGDPCSSFSSPRAATSGGKPVATNVVANPGICLSPIPFGVLNPSANLAPVFAPSRAQSLVQKAFKGFSGSPAMFTSTPLRKTETHTDLTELSFEESREKETKVHLSVEYPSKTIRKELKDDYAVLGKAIVHGRPQQIARAALKNETLKKVIVEKVLQLMTLQVNGLCSRRQPSMLRNTTKEGIAEFDFKKLCFEWKERAPLLYAFLMTCTSSKRQDNPEWLPSVSVAGSILLKQRNSHMNGCAAILGILLKSKSLEVILLVLYCLIWINTHFVQFCLKTDLLFTN